jgi:hypothetical protein
MKRRSILLGTLSLAVLLLASTVFAGKVVEPQKPKVDTVFDKAREDRVKALPGLAIADCFDKLKEQDFLVNQDFMHKGIHSAFKSRTKAAVARAMAYLRLPEKEVGGGGRTISRSRDLHVARKVLQVFPDEAADGLPDIYHSGDAVTRGNVIRAAGSVAGGQPIRGLLVDALDDTEFCEEDYPEISGEPLRICDVAYNQLVLRYRLKDVLRTIGTIDRIEIRDYHIGVLKNQLAQSGL